MDLNGGIVGLPNLAGRSYAVCNIANDSGVVVGTAATTLFGYSRLRVIWRNSVVSQPPLPAGETLEDANWSTLQRSRSARSTAEVRSAG